MRDAASFIASQSGSAEAGILGQAVGLVRQAWQAWNSRRAIAPLTEFDDHMLADIGLTRSDLREALDLPFGSDPGRELQFRAIRNRHVGWNR